MSQDSQPNASATVQQLKSMISVPEPDAEKIINLAAELSQSDYEQQRSKAAHSIGYRVSKFDHAVKKAGGKEQSNNSAMIKTIEPWSEPVILADILDQTTQYLRRYLHLPSLAAETIALWAAHTYVFYLFQHTPRLNITGPTKRCGKTLVLDILSHLVDRSLRAESISGAAIYRVIAKSSPTLLIDEYDTFIPGNKEIRGILNSGFMLDGQVIRCDGDDHEVVVFKTFSPVALAGIRDLPGTIKDRSVIIRMSRAKRSERPERFDSCNTRSLDTLARQFVTWADQDRDALAQSDPDVPDTQNHRAIDCWRPLIAIADCAGSEWPEIARKAFLNAQSKDDDADSTGELLLKDIRLIIKNRTSIGSHELVAALLAIDDSLWQEHGARGEPITPQGLSRLLKDFGIRPKQIKAHRGKGYLTTSFKDAFDRYLPTEVETPKPANDNSDLQSSGPKPSTPSVSANYDHNYLNSCDSFGVSTKQPGHDDTHRINSVQIPLSKCNGIPNIGTDENE
jgi:hypothetical protein